MPAHRRAAAAALCALLLGCPRSDPGTGAAPSDAASATTEGAPPPPLPGAAPGATGATVAPSPPAAPPPAVAGPAQPPGRGPVVLASGQVSPHAVVVDDAYVYWATGDSKVRRTRKSGGGPVETLSKEFAISLAVDERTLFFTTGSSGSSVLAMPKPGGATAQVFQGDALVVALDETHAYVISVKQPSIARVPKEGGAPVKIRTPTNPTNVAVGADGVYWTSYSGGTVMVAPKAGGPGRALVSGQPKPLGLALDERDVYFTCETDGSVRRAPRAGGKPEVLIKDQNNQETLVLDATHVYWYTWGSGRGGGAILRLDKRSGEPETIADRQSMPEGLALDETSVYWPAKGDGLILRAAK